MEKFKAIQFGEEKATIVREGESGIILRCVNTTKWNHKDLGKDLFR